MAVYDRLIEHRQPKWTFRPSAETFKGLIMSIPEEQKAKVKANLLNMRALNNEMQPTGNAYITNAFFRMSQTDNSNAAIKIMLDIMAGVFRAAATAAGGPEATIFATVLSGMISRWIDSPPPSLNGAFASYLTKYTATVNAIDVQLDDYGSSLQQYWNTTFTFDGKECSLSDLATLDFPAVGDVRYDQMKAKGLRALDLNIWETVVRASCQYYEHLTMGAQGENPQDTDHLWETIRQCYKDYPAYYCRGEWFPDRWKLHHGWYIRNWVLGPGGYPLRQTACEYIFIDGLPGETINPDALFTREYFFNNIVPGHPW